MTRVYEEVLDRNTRHFRSLSRQLSLEHGYANNRSIYLVHRLHVRGNTYLGLLGLPPYIQEQGNFLRVRREVCNAFLSN